MLPLQKKNEWDFRVIGRIDGLTLDGNQYFFIKTTPKRKDNEVNELDDYTKSGHR